MATHHTEYERLWQFAGEVAGHLSRLQGESWQVQPFLEEERGRRRSVRVYRIDEGLLEFGPMSGLEGYCTDCPGFHLGITKWADIDAPKARILIVGNYPLYKGQSCTPYHEALPRITVAVKRGASTVAMEIRRRFLKAYLSIYERTAKTVESSRTYDENKDRAFMVVADAAGVEVQASPHRDGNKRCSLGRHGDPVSCTIFAHEPGEVKVTFDRCPTDLAMDIVRMTREYLDATRECDKEGANE